MGAPLLHLLILRIEPLVAAFLVEQMLTQGDPDQSVLDGKLFQANYTGTLVELADTLNGVQFGFFQKLNELNCVLLLLIFKLLQSFFYSQQVMIVEI